MDRARVQEERARVQVDWARLQVGRTRVQVGRTRLQVGRTRVQVNRARVQVNRARVQVDRVRVQVDRAGLQIGRVRIELWHGYSPTGPGKIKVNNPDLRGSFRINRIKLFLSQGSGTRGVGSSIDSGLSRVLGAQVRDNHWDD